MTIPVIYNETGISGTAARFFDTGKFDKYKRASSIVLFVSVREGTNAVPILHFFDDDEENPGKEAEKTFFGKIMQPPFRLFVFTELPPDKLKVFHNSYFQDSTTHYKIKCTIHAQVPEASATPYRWMEFTREAEFPGGRVPDSLVKWALLRPRQMPTLHRAYIDPIFLSGNLSPDSAYHSLFHNRQQLPIALPPQKQVANNTYFGKYSISGKIQDGDSINKSVVPEDELQKYFVPAVRKAFRERLLSHKTANRNTLFAELWAMSDNPAFTEYLKDGAFFTFHAYDEESGQKQAQELGGKPSVTFHYAGAGLHPNDVLKKWKAELLQLDEAALSAYDDDKPSEVEKIKQAIYSDIQAAIVGSEPKIKEANKIADNSWEQFAFPEFDLKTSRDNDGWWAKIHSLSEEIRKPKTRSEETDDPEDQPEEKGNPEIHTFMQEHILYPAENRGNVSHDHSLALDRFSEYLCRFPFENVVSENYSEADEPDFKSEWQIFLMDFIQAKGNLSPASLDPNIVIQGDRCTYSASLSPRQIFRLRLMLPANTRLESSFSSVLNYNNALNYNFVL